MKLVVVAPPKYDDWEKFQSVVDSIRELYELKWIVAPRPHPLITLYCKTDIIACYINSLREVDKYDAGLIFSSASNTMELDCEAICYAYKPYYIYHTDIDEFSFIHVTNKTT
jgi:hypothetical protein